MKKKIYIRLTKDENSRAGDVDCFELFEGTEKELEKDRKYWKEVQEQEARYFELKEKK